MDPYSVLGVSQSASLEEIRRAFRKLAARYHPDRNPDNKVAERIYKDVSAAYELLTNPRKQGPSHSPGPAPASVHPFMPPFVRGGRKKKGPRRGYMPPRSPGAPARPEIKPGASYTVRPDDVKLGGVPLKDLPPWMPRAKMFGKDPLDRGGPS
jgi:hypothetical protein